MKPAITPLFGILRSGLRSATRVSIVSAIVTLLTLAAQGQIIYTPSLTNIWVVPAGSYYDLTNNSANNVRGIAIDPLTTNVLYASTVSSNHVSIVSFTSGSNYVGALNKQTVSAGTLAMAPVRAANDGSIYTCNISGAPTSRFLVFKWAGETLSVDPVVVYDSGLGTSFQWRVGDYMDVRGSGENTEIVAVGNGTGANISTNFVVLRPTDSYCTNFTNFSITIPGGALTLCGGGIAFEGTNNAVWIRRTGSQETRRITYTPGVMASGACARTNTVDQSACTGLKYYASTNGVQLLATVQTSTTIGANQKARVFQVPTSPTAAFISVLNSNIPAVTGSQNGNGAGNVDAQNGYFVFGAPGNGLSFFGLDWITNSPPSVNASASASTIVQGYPVTFTAIASGSTPLTYQWYFNTNTLIPGATTNVYSINSVQATNVGVYTLITTNLYGAVTNSVSLSTVLPNGASALTTNLWSLAPGSRTYLTTGDTQRGLAFDPILTNLVLVSRSTTNGVHLLTAATGADAGEMDLSYMQTLTPIPGTYQMNACGVADDGAVYVCNLLSSDNYPTGGADYFAIYRWADASGTAIQAGAYGGSPLGAGTFGFAAGGGTLGRLGDSMAVRGSGINTEILCPFRNGTNVCIFTTTDGTTFTANIIAITNLVASIGGTDPFTGNSPLALGCAFGTGKTFWAKSANYNLRQVSYDLATGQGGVIGSYPLPGSEAPIGVDNSNGYVAAIGVNETPQNLAIFNLFAAGGPSLSSLLDRELFPVDNSNGNGTGAVAVDAAGGRMFALDSNSGIIALSYAGTAFIAAGASQQVVTWGTSASTLQSTTNLTVPFADVVGATSPYTNSTDEVKFFRLKK